MAGDTKARLITAAERLFAEQGVDAVSLREIGRMAGARNVIAVPPFAPSRSTRWPGSRGPTVLPRQPIGGQIVADHRRSDGQC